MNCLKKMKRKIHNIILIAFYSINGFSLIYWMCWIDAIVSWQPYVIMIVNFAFLMLGAYANGWIVDTEPYFEREEKEND